MKEKAKTQWHELFEGMLEELLTWVKIKIHANFPIMSKPPRADVLLMHNNCSGWTKEQRERLPDGIRDCKVPNILLEFKPLNKDIEDGFLQLLGYFFFYKDRQKIKKKDIRAIFVSCQTMSQKTQKEYGFQEIKKGVYESSYPLLKRMTLILPNELENTPYNAPFKCFSSRVKEKEKGFLKLEEKDFPKSPESFYTFMKGMSAHLFSKEGENMAVKLTKSDVMKMGKNVQRITLGLTSLKEKLKGEKPKDIVKQLKTEDIVKQIKPEDLLRHLKREEIEAYLKKTKKRIKNKV